MLSLDAVLVLLVLGVTAIRNADGAMTMHAFKQAKGMMTNICHARTGVSKELLTQMSNGEFPEADDRKLKCYFECLLRMSNAMKGNKVSVDALRRAVRTMIPAELKPLVTPSIDACQDIDEGDACEAAYAFVKCHYKTSGVQGFIFS